MKALVVAFNQEKALVGAFPVIVKLHQLIVYSTNQDMFTEQFFDQHSVASSEVRLVMGLHPDEATEPLLDTALASSINFAVIPCCVFSQLFPHRRLRNNEQPVSYEAFCDYLCEKSLHIESEKLPFLGKNRVLYTNL